MWLSCSVVADRATPPQLIYPHITLVHSRNRKVCVVPSTLSLLLLPKSAANKSYFYSMYYNLHKLFLGHSSGRRRQCINDDASGEKKPAFKSPSPSPFPSHPTGRNDWNEERSFEKRAIKREEKNLVKRHLVPSRGDLGLGYYLLLASAQFLKCSYADISAKARPQGNPTLVVDDIFEKWHFVI